MKNILFLIYLLLTIIFFPFIFIIDIFINLKRKDLLYFLYKRYIFPFLTVKRVKNKKYIFIIATSAGEISTIIDHLDKIFKNNIFIIFTTSTTGYKKLKSLHNNNCIKNIFFTYLFPENFIYTLIYYLKFKPEKTVFVENEIWPSILIVSNLFKIQNIFIQAKIEEKEFKKITKIKPFFELIYSLFDIIFTVNQKSYIYFKTLLKKNKIINSGNLKINTRLPLPEHKIPKLKSITFASTHKEEEEIFVKAILKIINDKNHKNTIIFFVPRHPERAQSIYQNFKYILQQKNLKKYIETSNIQINLLSQLNSFNNLLKNIFLKDKLKNETQLTEKIVINILNDDNFIINNNNNNNNYSKNKNKNNYSNYNNNNYNNYNYNNYNNYTNNNNYNNNNKSDNKKNNKNVKSGNDENIKIIIIDEFGLLYNIYSLSYISVIGATFSDLGGGHNIIEPIYYNNFVISGPYLKNLKDIFNKGIEKKICILIEKDIDNQLFYHINNKLKNFKPVYFLEPLYLNDIIKNHSPIEIIKKNLNNKNN